MLHKFQNYFLKRFARKEFLNRVLKIMSAYFLGKNFIGNKKIFSQTTSNTTTDSEGSKLTIIKGKDLSKETIFKMVDKGLENLGGINKFIKKGMNVVIKPNIGFNAPPESAFTTNPHLVEAVAKKCVETGAKVTVFDRPVHTDKLCYRNSKILEAIENAGAKVHYMDDRKFKEVKIKNGINLNKLEVYEEIIKADFIINMPIAKHHSSANLTMSMKNLMGVIGGRRGWFHLYLHENIVDFNKAVPVQLVILDALRILTANGPASGTEKDVKETNTIVMGTNPVSVDAYTTSLFNKKPTDLEYLTLAAKEKMGEIDIKKLNIQNINV
ncbi:MAG: DUF362 domain-containing protein [Spirochaetia bacterium]|nr:DUF362 domain-containing protein [Spirochaetia bacterium]